MIMLEEEHKKFVLDTEASFSASIGLIRMNIYTPSEMMVPDDEFGMVPALGGYVIDGIIGNIKN
jgi:hypothetical protein